MRATWNACGLRGAVLAHILMSVAMVIMSALACLTCRATDGEATATFMPVLFGAIAAAAWTQWFLAFRPVTASLVLLSVCAWLLLRDRRLRERSRAVWLLPPLVIITTNLHFLAVLTPIWLGALLGGAVWEHRRPGFVERTESLRRIRRYAALLAVSTLALLATPMLPGIVATVGRFAAADPMVASRTITELQFIWENTHGLVLALMAGASLVWLVCQRRHVRAGEGFWLLAMTALMIWYARFTPLFAMVAAPLLARTLPAMPDRVLRLPAVWVVSLFALCVGAWRVLDGLPKSDAPPCEWLNRFGPARFGYPCAAADYVEANVPRRPGHLLNNFGWGGFLGWRLAGWKVFVDGRTQLYPREFWQKFFFSDRDTTKAALVDLIARDGVDAAILPVNEPHFRPLLIELGWTSPYRDDQAEVLVPPQPQSDP